MASTEKLLSDILQTLKAIQASLAARPAGQSGKGGADVASDEDLDGPYGNPSIKSDPKRWDGPSFAGCKYSECPPEYLDAVASFKDWQAGKDDEAGAVDKKGRPKGNWARKDAKFARGWAQRLRDGWNPPEDSGGASEEPSQPSTDYGGAGAGDDDIPFIFCDVDLMGRERWWR